MIDSKIYKNLQCERDKDKERQRQRQRQRETEAEKQKERVWVWDGLFKTILMQFKKRKREEKSERQTDRQINMVRERKKRAYWKQSRAVERERDRNIKS